ncbi:hypothetical protein [Pleomorphovibrio marinus]|uniref:hypothetical protein n=1 Tax=Pleomorphovibrio marinus TaxID=2164132 RepID=UPI0013006B04|nr:hypothetical protein [Pleomorphovibrio marinus]
MSPGAWKHHALRTPGGVQLNGTPSPVGAYLDIPIPVSGRLLKEKAPDYGKLIANSTLS